MKKWKYVEKKKRKYGVFFLIVGISLLFGESIYSKKNSIFSERKQNRMTPDQVLQDLINGNKRFCDDVRLKRRSLMIKAQKASERGQFPKAVILACMDSRSIPELVFDQTIADIFTLRVAGNVINDDMLASLEYATKHSGSKLIVIMGHTQCGAISAVCAGKVSGNLEHLVASIQPAVEMVQKQNPNVPLDCSDDATIRAIAMQNVRNMIARVIKGSAVICELLASGSIKIVGALQDLKTGFVTFFE